MDNLPNIFNSMVLEYARLTLTYQRHNVSQQMQRIKRVKTQERLQDKKDDPDDVIGNLMAATQNNLIKMHQTHTNKDMTFEIKNFHVENKPMYRITRAFQWAHENEESLMLANLNSLIANFPESLKHIDLANSMCQFLVKLDGKQLLDKV